MSRNPLQLLRDFMALSGGEVIAKIAGFAAFAYLSRVLGAEAYGATELAVALVTFASLIVDFGFGPIAAADLMRDPARAPSVAVWVPSARIGLAFLAYVVVVAASLALDLSSATRTLIWVFGLSLFLHPWIQNWLFQGMGLMTLVAPAQAIRMLVLVVGFVLFVRGPDGLWKVGAVEIGAVGAMVLYYLVAQRSQGIGVGLEWNAPYLRSLFERALPVSASQLLWAFNLYVPTVMVAALATGSEVAWFGSSLRIVVSLNTFVWLYFFNLYPTFVENAAEPYAKSSASMERSLRLTAWAGVFSGLLGAILAEPICRLAYGTEFAEAGRAFAILVWVLPISLLSGHARFSLIAYGHQRWELLSAAAGSLATVILCIALVPGLGAEGAAIAMVVAAIVVWLVAHRYAVRGVGPLLLITPVLRPSIAAGLSGLLIVRFLDQPIWLEGGVAFVVYIITTVLLDRSLRSDLAALFRHRIIR